MKPQFIYVLPNSKNNEKITLHIQGSTQPATAYLEITKREALVMARDLIDAAREK